MRLLGIKFKNLRFARIWAHNIIAFNALVTTKPFLVRSLSDVPNRMSIVRLFCRCCLLCPLRVFLVAFFFTSGGY